MPFKSLKARAPPVFNIRLQQDPVWFIDVIKFPYDTPLWAENEC
jgi:hypothetical protein